MPGHLLCTSLVLLDYLDHPHFIPQEVTRNGYGTLTFRVTKHVLQAVVEYLKKSAGMHGLDADTAERNGVFYVQLYNFALQLK